MHQQVILYDKNGNPVGGGKSTSDNKPRNLPEDATYREEWTNISATGTAARARYQVWPGYNYPL